MGPMEAEWDSEKKPCREAETEIRLEMLKE